MLPVSLHVLRLEYHKVRFSLLFFSLFTLMLDFYNVMDKGTFTCCMWREDKLEKLFETHDYNLNVPECEY